MSADFYDILTGIAVGMEKNGSHHLINFPTFQIDDLPKVCRVTFLAGQILSLEDPACNAYRIPATKPYNTDSAHSGSCGNGSNGIIQSQVWYHHNKG